MCLVYERGVNMKTKKKVIVSISIVLVLALAAALTYVIWKINMKVSGFNTEYEQYNFNELIEASHVIVKGHIKGKADTFIIRPANGADDSVFTQYQFEVDDVIRGDVSVGESIGIRFEGGQKGSLKVINHDDEDIKIKDSDKMVLFLYRVTVGGGYTTNDEYYQVVGGSNQGIFFLDESAEKETYKSNSRNFDPLEWDTARAQLVELANELPMDKSGLLEHETEQLKAELESGKITQDEYDTRLERYGKYATIID